MYKQKPLEYSAIQEGPTESALPRVNLNRSGVNAVGWTMECSIFGVVSYPDSSHTGVPTPLPWFTALSVVGVVAAPAAELDEADREALEMDGTRSSYTDPGDKVELPEDHTAAAEEDAWLWPVTMAAASEHTAQADSPTTVLLLHGARQPYELTDSHPVPELHHDGELLVRTQVIGLNPIDWKAPDFNFGIPELPYIAGRELAGEVVRKPSRSSRLQVGDRVLVISTDYRDLRKAAYQQYVVAPDYNTVRLPPTLSFEAGATLGVAFVAAALALGVCMGVDFSGVLDGPDLYALVRQIPPDTLAADIRAECLDSIRADERAQPGDWLAVWGASSTSANLALQLAALAGLRTLAVADTAKHGLTLAANLPARLRPRLLVDSHEPRRAVAVLRANTSNNSNRSTASSSSSSYSSSSSSSSSSRAAGTTTTTAAAAGDADADVKRPAGEKQLRFGLDTRGAESAGWLARALSPGVAVVSAEKGDGGEAEGKAWDGGVGDGVDGVDGDGDGKGGAPPPSPPATPRSSALLSAHLVGLTGLPKPGAGAVPEGVVCHTVPIKLFHEVPAVGEALVAWLERLLARGLVTPPPIIDVEQGLGSVNRGLDRMRKGEISGGKLVVRVD
ncbi:8ab1ba10-45ee-4f2b-939b-24e87a13223c [Thermothielavioides terrestris]|uniref:8ab1ba10-45ee-4f2b-939b-24e87a13223c n=1 Tax=Thermothielavioides terrestris TaxID=2587410 RepID=A0A3S4F4G4_9PEZI|nr:8ab1ba10-45ee-4f2b-939b-24e87a13223c [Thermothielavioides terrestris]